VTEKELKLYRLADFIFSATFTIPGSCTVSWKWWPYDPLYLFVTVPISRTNAYAQTGLMVCFLPVKKKTGLVTCNHMVIIIIKPSKHRFCFFTNTLFHTYRSDQVLCNVANESILAPLSKQTESNYFPHQCLGFAIFL
jgi:hypothetical protein